MICDPCLFSVVMASFDSLKCLLELSIKFLHIVVFKKCEKFVIDYVEEVEMRFELYSMWVSQFLKAF